MHTKYESNKIYAINPYYRKALGFQVLGREDGKWKRTY
jgi:hypothetical protein